MLSVGCYNLNISKITFKNKIYVFICEAEKENREADKSIERVLMHWFISPNASIGWGWAGAGARMWGHNPKYHIYMAITKLLELVLLPSRVCIHGKLKSRTRTRN